MDEGANLYIYLFEGIAAYLKRMIEDLRVLTLRDLDASGPADG